MTYDLTVRAAVPSDLVYVMSLMRANRESVGGLPRPAVMERLERGTVLLALLNDDPVGYILYDIRQGVLRIPQACIQYDARRRRYGEALVRQLVASQSPTLSEISLRCAADLEANVFWRDMGFSCIGTVPGGRRRARSINLWTMWLVRKLIRLEDVALVPAAQVRVDAMYDDSGFMRGVPTGFVAGRPLEKIAWANQPTKAPSLGLE